MTEYKSSIKSIPYPIGKVYDKLSNLENLNSISNLIKNEHSDKVSINIINQDECEFDITGAGKIIFKIIDKEPNKTIKFEAQSSPIPIKIWIQLIEPNINDTRLRITLHTEMNFMIKKMIGNKLEQGVDNIAEMLSKLPY